MLGHIGQEFGRAEVGDGLDRQRGPRVDADPQLGRNGAGLRQGGQRGANAAVKHQRVDAPGEVAQLSECFLGVAVGGVGEHAGAAAVILPAGGRLEEFLDLAKGHGKRGETDLGPVMQVPLDPAEPGSGFVDRAGAPFLQFTAALGRGGEASLRVTLGFGPGGAVLKRRIVGAPQGHGVAQHPGGQR